MVTIPPGQFQVGEILSHPTPHFAARGLMQRTARRVMLTSTENTAMYQWILETLERVPLTPWWFAKRNRRRRLEWVRHIERYHLAGD